MGFMARFRKHLGKVEKVAGALLVVSGLMFITGGVQAVSYWLIERFPFLLNLG
jgi:cytochrome c-type biogenesis protein